MYLFAIVLTCVAVSLYLIKLWLNGIQHWQRLNVVSPKPHMLFGHIGGIRENQSFNAILHKHYRQCHRPGLPFIGLNAFFRPIVFVTDPEFAVRILTTDFAHFRNRGLYHNENDLSSNLFTLDYDKWKVLRAKFSPTFTNAKLKVMFPKFVSTATDLVEVLAKDTLKHTGVVDIKDLLLRFTTDIIGSCAFGIYANSLHNANSNFSKIAHKAALGEDNGLMAKFIMFCLPNFAYTLRLKYMPQHLIDFYSNFVRDIFASRQNLNIRHNDFMDLLLDHLKRDAADMTMTDAVSNALLFFQAGHETSAHTLTYALYELARNHDIQQRARQEIYSILRDHNEVLSNESLGHMKYVQQIIKETLRLYPLSPTIVRQCTQDYTVTDYPDAPPIIIRKDQMVLISAYSFQHDELYYSQAETFNPDNFAEDKVESKKILLSFGDGPRNCIGMRFAHMQISVGLVLLLQNFTFEFCDKTEDPIEFKAASVLLPPKNEIYLRVNKLTLHED